MPYYFEAYSFVFKVDQKLSISCELESMYIYDSINSSSKYDKFKEDLAAAGVCVYLIVLGLTMSLCMQWLSLFWTIASYNYRAYQRFLTATVNCLLVCMCVCSSSHNKLGYSSHCLHAYTNQPYCMLRVEL